MNLAGAAPGADLGGSSQILQTGPGSPMWRRVSCEQPLDTSQSILRLRGSLDQTFGEFTMSLRETNEQPKGNLVHIPEPGSGTVFDLCQTWQHEQTGRRPPKLWEELSFLHKPPRPWNPLAGRMGRFGTLAKSAALFAASTSGRWDLENPGGVTAISRQLVPISAAGLQVLTASGR